MAYRLLLVSIILFFGGFFLLPQNGQAIGLSPAILEVKDLLPENTVERNFWFSRAVTNQAEGLHISLIGNGAGAISLPQGQELIFSVGQDSVAYPIVINGEGLAPGNYEARLIIEPLNEATGVSGSSITVGTSGVIRFSITDEIREAWEITSVDIKETGSGSLVNLEYTVKNTGNIETKPDKIIFTATNFADNADVTQEEISAEKLTATQPFSESSFTLPLASQFKKGIYNIQLSFFQDDKLVYENKQLNLQVWMENSNNNVNWYTYLKKNYILFIGAALFSLAIVIIMFYIITKK